MNYRKQIKPILNYYLVEDAPWKGVGTMSIQDSAEVDSRWCIVVKKGIGTTDIDGAAATMLAEPEDLIYAAVHGKANLENIERDCGLYMLSSLDILGIYKDGLMQPIGQLILIKLDSVEEVTESNLVIPGKKRSLPNKGVVAAVGKGFVHWNGEETKFQVKPGDRVLFNGFSTIKIDWDWIGEEKEEYVMVQHTDIYGHIEED